MVFASRLVLAAPLSPFRRSLTTSSNIACIFGAVKFKLSEADRLNRKGEAVEARSLYLEAQKAAEAGSQDALLRAGDAQLAAKMQTLAQRWPRSDSSRVSMQAAIEAALLQAEEASAAMAV